MAGGLTAVVAFGAGFVLAIARNNPVGLDAQNPQLLQVERALDAEVGSMLLVSLAFGLFSSVYLVVRSSKWYRLSSAIRPRDAGLVGLLNIAGLMLLGAMAYVVGRANVEPMLGIILHLAAALAVNVSVYEYRFRTLKGRYLNALVAEKPGKLATDTSP